MSSRLYQFFRQLDSDLSQPLRIRLFRLMCAITCVLCLFVVLPVNAFQNLPVLVNVGDVLLGLLGGYCYWASMRGRHHVLGFFLTLLVMMEPIWFLNAGSEGSVTYYFYAVIMYPLAILRGRTRWILIALVVLNLFGLLLVEYFHPALTVPFHRPLDRLLDLLSGIFCSYLALVLFIWLILRNYDREQVQLSGYAQELAASEQNYREIFNSTSDAMFIRDDSGRLVDFNDRTCTMFGYDRAAMAALSIGELSLGTSPYSQEEGMQKVRQTIQEGPQIFIWRSRRRDGELFWSEVALRAAEIGGKKRVISSVRDISARRRAEEAMRTNEERLRLALAASLQGWFDLNLVTGEGIASEEYARIIGMAPVEFKVTLQGWLEGIHPEDRTALLQEFQACIATGGVRSMEYRRKSATGEWKWIRSIGKIVEFDAAGKPVRMAGTHTDITERKELEARLLHSQRLEAVGTLAAGVAHDLNNILTPMLMASGVLEEKLTDTKDRELMALLENGAKRGAAIVRQLLTFSRDMAQSRVSVDLAQQVREMMGIMRATFPPSIKLAADLPQELWRVTADPIQLHQVLMNLCINARDAMPAGGSLTLRAENIQMRGPGVSTDPWGKGKRFVKLTVTDTGDGIPPEHLSRIFDPFFSTKEPGKGTGLGLSTVYGIVKAHGGSISVDSETHQGSSFKVILPASAPPLGSSDPAAAPAQPAS